MITRMSDVRCFCETLMSYIVARPLIEAFCYYGMLNMDIGMSFNSSIGISKVKLSKSVRMSENHFKMNRYIPSLQVQALLTIYSMGSWQTYLISDPKIRA